jgi:predicted flavoprotein YhiN
MANSDWDIVVVGAGAAGLLAAIHAAECGRRVLVLEKNRRPGVKILKSGGTHCEAILRNELPSVPNRRDEPSEVQAPVLL